MLYVSNFEVYEEYIVSIDSFVSISSLLVYYMEIIIFLVWLFQLHKDMKACFSFYPISPWGAMLRMVPVLNIWGLGDTFTTLGRLIERYDTRHGKSIKYSIPFLYITFFGLNYINKWIGRQGEDVSDGSLIWGMAFEIAFAVVIIFMAHHIRIGMISVADANSDKLHRKLDLALVQAVTDFMKSFNDVRRARAWMTDSFARDLYYSSRPNPQNEPTIDEIIQTIGQSKNPSLIHYKIEDYQMIDEETFEVLIYQEFIGKPSEHIIYIAKKHETKWMLDRMVRLHSGIITNVEETEHGSYLIELQSENSHVKIIAGERPDRCKQGDEVKIWAYLDVEQMPMEVQAYILYEAHTRFLG
ncbi:hypothetical protein ACFQ88_11995 [Paenibacillus sp. NPDC056579]|uniref:hypothetical protein n=1 Tax=unclassified Paenibacillus TaxID=185978 RepID=UPI001EF89AFD|nr:hypothetical protein [Paenibacillus sp. H1-7]